MRAEARTHHPLAALGKRQGGVVSQGQLRDLGYSEAAIGRAVKAGRLHRVHRGVYAVGHTRLSRYGRCFAAVLACGTRALLSHASAAWLWGFHPQCPGTPEVTVPTRGQRRSGMRLHHAPALGDRDRARQAGIPVTSVARTLLDTSAASPRRLRRTIERAERLGLFDLRDVDDVLARASGHPGAGRLRRALVAHREPAFSHSDLERHFLLLILEARLPRPATNTFVAGYELDAFWERERFAVELDTYEPEIVMQRLSRHLSSRKKDSSRR